MLDIISTEQEAAAAYRKNFGDCGQTDDLLISFCGEEAGKIPVDRAVIRTAAGDENLVVSAVQLSSGLLMTIMDASDRDADFCLRTPDQQQVKLEGYRKRKCIFRRNGDSNSNFYTVSPAGDGTVWIENCGERSLRFQMPDGTIYRVCAGCMEALQPSNAQAKISPTEILLDLGGNPLDFCVSAVYVRYGMSDWMRGGIDCQEGGDVDSFFCRVLCGDDCHGVLELRSSYYLSRPGLILLDIDGYGQSMWYVRNKGEDPLPLIWPSGVKADVPPDGFVYAMEDLPVT